MIPFISEARENLPRSSAMNLACTFCKIIRWEERAWVVYKDNQTMALLDRYPVTKGHTLIIPVRHYDGIFDIPGELLNQIVSLSKKLSLSYEKSLRIQGVSIELLDHRQKKPEFRHFHLHVVPRYDKDDPRDPANVKPSQRFPKESDENLDVMLSRIRKDLDDWKS
jgi:histidine triad (HIT) family protein